MTSLLRSMFFRLTRCKMFWIMLGVVAVMPLLELLLLTSLGSALQSVEQEVTADAMDVIRAQNVTASELSGLASVMPLYSLLAVICTSVFLSKDFSNGTIRNIIVANHSRLEIYASHLVVAMTVGACYMTATLLFDLIFVGSVFGFVNMSALQITVAILLAFAMGLVSTAFVQSMMCMLLFASKKLSVALACTIAICMALPSLIVTVITFVGTVDLIFNGTAISTDAMSWVPLVNAEMLDVSSPDAALVGKILLYMLPLTVFFVFMGWVGFRKSNLK